MDDLKNLVIAGVPDKVKEKILELVQCWSSAFRDKPEYKIVVDTHNLLKMNGFEFPVLKEADAMFMADSAPDWMEGDNCYRYQFSKICSDLLPFLWQMSYGIRRFHEKASLPSVWSNFLRQMLQQANAFAPVWH